MGTSGQEHRRGGARTGHSVVVRRLLVTALLLLGVGDLAVIDLVLLPRYLAESAGASLGRPAAYAQPRRAVAPEPAKAAPVAPPIPVIAPVPRAEPTSVASPPTAALDKGPSLDHPDARPATAPASPSEEPTPVVAANVVAAAEPVPASEPADAPAPFTFPPLLFGTNTAWLSPASKATLDQLAQLMRSNPSLHVTLSGHTDDQGTPELNRALSLDRAGRARQWLQKGGIEASRIRIEGFGSKKPARADLSDRARAYNRRVEINCQ